MSRYHMFVGEKQIPASEGFRLCFSRQLQSVISKCYTAL